MLTVSFLAAALPWQISSLRGACGETVPLYPPLLTSRIPQSWLASLGGAMRHSLAVGLHECLLARLSLEKKFSVLLQGKTEEKTERDALTARDQVLWWLTNYPLQCILAAEAIIQSREITKVLEGVHGVVKAALLSLR